MFFENGIISSNIGIQLFHSFCMPRYLSQDSFQPKTLGNNPKQHSLELQNKELERAFKDKQQILTLRLNFLNDSSKNIAKQPFLYLIEQLLKKQNQIRLLFSQQLLTHQIKIEQARQMKEIIINYQKRIADLRAALINKEGDISAESFQFLRGTVTRRQNLEAIHCETLEKMALTKYANERKKLLVEVQALEDTISEKKKSRKPKQKRNQQQKGQNLKKQLSVKKTLTQRVLNKDKQKFDPISCKWPKDLLTDKAIKLVQQQTRKHEQQLKLIEKLKLQIMQVEKQQLKDINRYKKLEYQWSKMLLQINQASTQDFNKGSNQLSFIKELEEQVSNTNSDVINSELFSNIDTNKIESQSQVFKSLKHNSTATSINYKRYKQLKQN